MAERRSPKPKVAGSSPVSPAISDLMEQISTSKHELNNVLMGLIGHIEMLLDMKDLSANGKKRAEAIMEQAQRVAERVRSIDAFGEQPPEER